MAREFPSKHVNARLTNYVPNPRLVPWLGEPGVCTEWCIIHPYSVCAAGHFQAFYFNTSRMFKDTRLCHKMQLAQSYKLNKYVIVK